MAYTYRHLSAADVAKVKADVVKTALPVVPDASLLRAWEADLAAHEAWRDSKTGDAKKSHDDAIKALEAALTSVTMRT